MNTKHYTYIALIIALLFAYGTRVSAEEEAPITAETEAAANNTWAQVKVDARVRVETKETKNAVIQNIKARSIEGKTQAEIKREEEKAKLENLKESIREKQDERKENISDKRDEIKTKKEERKAKLSEAVKKRIEKHAQKMIERINAAITRVEKLVLRTESRILKFESSGVNATTSKAHIVTAKAEITAAKTDASGLPGALAAALSSTTPKTALETTFKPLTESIKDHLKASHRSLQMAVSSLKPGQNKITATSTPGTSTTTATSTSN